MSATAAGSASTSTADWTGTRSPLRSRTPTPRSPLGRWWRKPPALLGSGTQALGHVGRRQLGELPTPTAHAAPLVHSALGAEPERVLDLDHRDHRRRGEDEPDQGPVRLGGGDPVALEAGVHALVLLRVDRLVPAADRVAVVGAGVDDLVGRVVLRD